MSYAKQLLDTYARSFNADAALLARTIDALSDCAQACTACADDCLSEQNVAELIKCIRLDLDCADVCTATLRVASRQTEYDANLTRPLLEACAAACKSCGDECQRRLHLQRHAPTVAALAQDLVGQLLRGRARRYGPGVDGRVEEGVRQATSVPRRVHSAMASMASEPAARTGWTGANHCSAPPAPMASTTSMLQTGQPMASSDSRLPPVATVALRSPSWTIGRR
jgi:hypothetical protein